MKILQIINSLGTGGAEKLLLDTLPLYNQQGIEMDVLLLWDNDLPFTRALKATKCCKVHILQQSSNPKHIYSPSAIRKIKKILKNYDLAHVHLFPAQYYVVFANLLNGNKTKLIFTEHNTSNTRINNIIFKPLERFIYKKYERIICITEEIQQIYREYLKSSKKLALIHNGVDIHKIKEAKPLSRKTLSNKLENDDFLLIQVSGFRNQKDQPTLIQSLAHLPDQVKLLLVGEGENKQKCQDLVTQLNLGNRVLFLGQRMDVPELLKTADLVVLSSFYEGLSLASIEGMASGKPFIASDAPGLREVVKGAGILFPVQNVEALVREIQELIDDKNHYQHVAKSCMERASQYAIEHMVQKHITLFQEVLAE